MRLMRAVFSCSGQKITQVVSEEGMDSYNLALHEESDDKEAIVSGDVSAVMTLIGAMTSHGFENLVECWQYEC